MEREAYSQDEAEPSEGRQPEASITQRTRKQRCGQPIACCEQE